MQRIRLSFVIILTLSLALVGLVGAQDDGMKVYPQQYASVADWVAAGGADIMSYNEAPMLAERVAAGELPPVAERLPAEPAVLDPLEGIGVYGGELAGPTTSPNCCGWDVSEMLMQKLFTIDTDLQSIIPNVARGYELSEDQTQLTIHLREGHRWSDGEPFTTEDFRFWPRRHPLQRGRSPPASPVSGTQAAKNQRWRSSTRPPLRYTFAIPHPAMIVRMASNPRDRGHRPAHYFRQFHIDYNPNANELAAEAGYDDWVQLINARLRPYRATGQYATNTDPYSPTLNTYVFASEDSFGNKYFERNPYFHKVDTAGNQLPYTDGLRRILVENLEVQDLKAIAGEFSHFGWGKLLSYPTYVDSAEVGGYRVALVTYNRGNEYSMMFNLTHPNEAMRAVFQDVRFRQAMSVAIDREEINELIYFGLADALAIRADARFRLLRVLDGRKLRPIRPRYGQSAAG